MPKNKSYKIPFHIILCALFASFLFIDDGIIGRLRIFNYAMLIVVISLTVYEIFRAAKGDKNDSDR